MKNLTLRIDEKTLAAARKEAALRGTTVAKVVREYLTAYAVAHLPSSAAAKRTWPSPDQASGAPGFAEPNLSYDDQAALEVSAASPPTLEEMTTATGASPEPGHDAWVRRQVQRTLDKKKAGALQYRDFDEVAARFGFNAR